MNLPITDNGIRPAAGTQDRCFYCHSAAGSSHKDNCVILEKSVVIRMTVEYIVAVPRHWDEGMIEHHRNDGSFCADNDIDALAEWVDKQPNPGPCTCNAVEYEFVREATYEDHGNMIDLSPGAV